MAWTDMAFNPPTGLEDHNEYQTEPATEDIFRQNMQDPSNQLRDYVNGSLKTFLGAVAPTAVLSGNGWAKFHIDALNKDLTVQWGTVSVVTLAGTPKSFTITFPIAFATACAVVNHSIGSKSSNAASKAYAWRANTPSTTISDNCYIYDEVAQTDIIHYIAIGY